MKGIKGFQVGRIVSQETRDKISQANNKQFMGICDYCKSTYHTKESHYKRQIRHFCCRKCYSLYRSYILSKEEQPRFGSGHTNEERLKRNKARSMFNHYLRDKKIPRQPCEVCGKDAQGHHDDYNKPLDVRWLCFTHHREWHKIHDNPELIK